MSPSDMNDRQQDIKAPSRSLSHQTHPHLLLASMMRKDNYMMIFRHVLF